MKLRFRHQKFQADAAKAVCDVFNGQPYLTATYLIDRGLIPMNSQVRLDIDDNTHTGIRNQPIVPELSDVVILENIRSIQRASQLPPSEKLVGRYNLTVEMETGVGKTYTYIKTMYELNKRFGWSKFIVVVPSVAIREGVHKSFDITQEHFAEEYGKKIRFFIYNSARLTDIEHFASDSAINVMIINSQAFNAKGKDARRIYMKLDSFRSRRPIDVIAKTNPILIIDEPQSVEGAATKERLKEFNALFTLRYSATHKKDSTYNMIYRLDAMEAYNKKLVKKIAVKGITTVGTTSTEGYLYLQSIVLSTGAPKAMLEFEVKGASRPHKVTRKVDIGYKVFEQSGGMEQYRDGYTIASIDGRDNSVTFLNGVKLFAGDVVGAVNEDQMRRIQIRETILSHLERERALYHRGIKVLSLFFIDEVAKYRQYDAAGHPSNGEYADVFEQEYRALTSEYQREFQDDEYLRYLDSIDAERTHAGYFSIDKNRKTGQERFVDSKLERGTTESGDSDAYDLIMRDKERLLSFSEPVRFVFSHSALREGWDNPNVFQICTLKQSGSDVRKRQEVGRGLRLCVNQAGERMDANLLGEGVHGVNVLTVIANESYDKFTSALQTEIAEAVADRPRMVDTALFVGKQIVDAAGNAQIIDAQMAQTIYDELLLNGYVRKGQLTDKYHEDKQRGDIALDASVEPFAAAIVEILGSVYDQKAITPENARDNTVTLSIREDQRSRREFQELWRRINAKSAYVVSFDTDELIAKAVAKIDASLMVSQILVRVERGEMADIESKQELLEGGAFERTQSLSRKVRFDAGTSVRYDLVGKIVEETGLTRAAVVAILKGIRKDKFDLFKQNPEEFILKASELINEQKATVIVQQITYHTLAQTYDTNVFTEPTEKKHPRASTIEVRNSLYDRVLFDSNGERDFAEKLDSCGEVAVYVKLPSGFYINTPVGKYNPDWAIAFYEGEVKHIYFVAETKGSLSTMQLRPVEVAKIQCATKHFAAISNDSVKYEFVDGYEDLMQKVMQ